MSWFAYITFCFLKMFILFKNTYITIFNMLFLICRELYKFVFIVQLLSRVQLFATPWAAAHQALLSFTISWSLLKFMSIESFSSCLNCLILCAPFSSCSQYFPASGSFPVIWFFASGSQSNGASYSESALPMNIRG